MPLWDVTSAGATTELGKFYDVSAAGTLSSLQTLYDVTTAGVSSVVFEDEYLLYDYGTAYVPFSAGTGNKAAGNFYPSESGRMRLSASSTTGDLQRNGGGTTNKIDLSSYNRLRIITQGMTDSYYQARLGVHSGRDFASGSVVVGTGSTFAATYDLNIASLSGSYYIGFRIGGGYYGNGLLYIYQVKLWNA